MSWLSLLKKVATVSYPVNYLLALFEIMPFENITLAGGEA